MKKLSILILIITAIGFVQCREAEKTSEPIVVSEPSEEELIDSLIGVGNMIMDISQKNLGGQLMKAMGEGGIPNAIEYCKLNAVPIVENLSQEHNAKISRKAIQYRNPDNEAKDHDADIFAEYADKLEGGIQMAPVVMLDESSATYYHPIIMADFCTACHGSKEVIGSDYEFISTAYPNDKAIGFETGDLRGLWKIEFKR